MRSSTQIRTGGIVAFCVIAICLCLTPALAYALDETATDVSEGTQQISIQAEDEAMQSSIAPQSSDNVNDNQASSTAKAKANTATSTSTAKKYKAGWKKSGSRWWYQDEDGTYPKNCSKVIDGITYRFDGAGWMRKGWVSEGGSWYYHASSGAMAKGWQKVGGKWYYMATDGKMLTGWQTVSGKKYYLASSGAMKTGWVKDNSKWYYLNDSGAMVTGWVRSSGKWYYLDKYDGRMLTGSFYTYLDENNSNTERYYANSSGVMQTGWQKINNKWYYFGRTGAMQKSTWISNTYWVGADGAMATNSWVDNGRYYVDNNGKWVKNAENPGVTQAKNRLVQKKRTLSWMGLSSKTNYVNFYSSGKYELMVQGGFYSGTWKYAGFGGEDYVFELMCTKLSSSAPSFRAYLNNSGDVAIQFLTVESGSNTFTYK